MKVFTAIISVGFLVAIYAFPAEEEIDRMMHLLDRQMRLLREFIGEIDQVDDRSPTIPVWRDISHMFTELGGMFQPTQQHYHQYTVFDPHRINETELRRRMRARMQQTKTAILELNQRINKIINETFGRTRPYGDDCKIVESNPQNGTEEKIPQNAEREVDRQTDNSFPLTVPEGSVGFELPIYGLIDRELLKQQISSEDAEKLNDVTSKDVGKIVRELISKESLIANVGQCRIANLIRDDKPLSIMP